MICSHLSYIFVIDVDTIGRQSLECFFCGFFLVIKSFVKVEFVLDEVQLLVIAHTADYLQALVFGQLAFVTLA